MSLIIPGGPGDPRRLAAKNPYRAEEGGAHGLSAGQIEALNERYERSLPKLVTSDHGYQRSKLLEDDFRRNGLSSSPLRRTGAVGNVIGGTNFGAGTLISAQTPYQPEFSSPDRQCLAEGTPVVMADGTWRPIEDVQVGDRVLDGKGSIAVVEAAWCEGVPDELVEICVWGGRKFLCTKNHKWPVWKWLRKCLCGCGKAVRPGACYVNHHHPKKGGPTLRNVWGTERNYDKIPAGYEPVQRLEAVDICASDLLLMPRKFDPVHVDKVDGEQARLLGYYVAEGGPSNGGLQTKFALNVDERNTLAADIMAICSRLGVDSYIYDEKTCAGISVFTKGDLRFGAGEVGDVTRSRDGGYYNRGPGRSRALHAWLEGLAGHGSHTKRLSAEVMRWPLRLKTEFVRGYFRGDGCQRWREVNKKKGISFAVTSNSTSAALSSQLSLIMAQIGFPCRAYPKAAFTDGTGTCHADSVSLELNGEAARRFADLIWQERSEAHERHARIETSTRVMQDDSFTYVKVNAVSVVPNLDKLRVFNLSVSGDHSYLVENIATFNSYPVHRVLANRYWRLFHKLDPVIGNCLDLYSDMPWSDFQLTGEGVDGDIKDHFETMSEKVDLLSLLPYVVREFLTVGEVILHCLYDADLRMWDYCTFHNPDNIEVIDAPFIRMDPILELIPDQRLRAILQSGDPLVQKIKAQLPPELLGRLLSRQNLPLDSLNCTFLPRKLHMYDVRGTSIISRLWRVLMLEDAVFCFVPGTYVTRADGTSLPIEILNVGDQVLDRNGQVATVKRAWAERSDRVKHIVLFGGREFRCTSNHRFPVWAYPRVCQCGCGKSVKWPNSHFAKHGARRGFPVETRTYGPALKAKATGRVRLGRRCVPASYSPMQEMRADDLRIGDYLLIPRKFREAIPHGITPAHAKLLGYYVSEGSPKSLNGKSTGIQWSLGRHEVKTLAEEIKQLCRKLGHMASIHGGGPSGCTVVLQRYEDANLSRFLIENGGVHALRKQLSACVMSWPLDLKMEFISGLFRGDGSRYGRSSKSRFTSSFTVSFQSGSERLVEQVFLILAQLGIYSAYSLVVSNGPLPGGKPRKKPSIGYRLQVKGHFADTLLKIVWGEKFNRHASDPNAWSKAWADDDYVYVPIRKVEDEPYDGDVYNLTVSGDHSYLVEGGIATFNSTSLATARRHSAPLKIAKIGNPQTGWIPGAEHEQRLLELLAQAELDPHSFLVYHFGVQFEAFGTTERAIWAPREWEGLERIKLVGLGVSKSFISGEVTYASSVTGLQVFLQRLLTMRSYFTQKWIKKKFFRPISEINDFIKPTKAELSHRVRVRRTAKELDEDSRYIVPDLAWDKPLDPNVDRDLIAAADSLTRIGVKFSKKTLMSFINRKYEDELKSSLEEEVLEAEERQKYEKQLGPAGQGTTGTQPGQDAQGNGQGQGQGQQGFQPPPKPALQPPPRPGSPPAPSQGSGTAPGQGQEASGEAQQPAIMRRPMPPPGRFQEDSEPVPERSGNWEEDEIRAVLEMFRTGRSDEAFWAEAATPVFRKAIEADDRAGAWDDLMLFLEAHGYPDADIGQLRRILVREGILAEAGEDLVADLYDRLPEDIGTDQDAEAAFLRAFRKQPGGNGAGRFSASLLVGEGFEAARGGGGNDRPFRRKR